MLTPSFVRVTTRGARSAATVGRFAEPQADACHTDTSSAADKPTGRTVILDLTTSPTLQIPDRRATC